MKYLKKSKTKKIKKKSKVKQQNHIAKEDGNWSKIIIDTDNIEEEEKHQDRSLHIEFEPNLKNDQINLIPYMEEIPSQAQRVQLNSRNFIQVAYSESFKKSKLKEIQEVGLETSQNVLFNFDI